MGTLTYRQWNDGLVEKLNEETGEWEPLTTSLAQEWGIGDVRVTLE